MNNKGSVTLSTVFAVLVIITLIMFAFLIPLLQKFTTHIYVAGDSIIVDSNAIAAQISDAEIREAFQDSFNAQSEATVTNIEILGFVYQYSWAIILLIVAFVLFMIARQQVETQGGGIYG